MNLTQGELKMVTTARERALKVAVLLENPTAIEQVHEAKRHLKEVGGTVDFLLTQHGAHGVARPTSPGCD